MGLEKTTGRWCVRCGDPLPADYALFACESCALQLAAQPPPEEASRPLGFDDLHAPLDPLPTVPGYRLRWEIGRGAMGVVYLARHESLDRDVALKLLLAADLVQETARARFQHEARSLAQLNHPGIVTVYDHGECDGQPYIAMEFVAGGDLAHFTGGQPLPPAEAARLVRHLAEAMAFAHSRGIFHRDLKPSNVLVDGGQDPRITDFGLAKRADFNPSLTLPDQVIGSPGYAAPEQIKPGREEVGPAGDLYSLGAVLYYLLTGRPPFMASTLADTLEQVLQSDPPDLRVLNPTVPRDLAAICLRCLEKRPQDRYASATALAADLNRFLAHEPVEANRLRPWRTARRWLRRYPLALPIQAGLALLLVLALVAILALTRQLKEESAAFATSRERARQEIASRDASREQALHRNRLELYASRINAAQLFWNQNDPEQAWANLNACRTEHPGWEYHHLQTLFTQGHQTLRGHGSTLYALAFSPDGHRLASGSGDSTLRIWDADSGDLLRALVAHRSWVTAVAFLSDGKRLITTGRQGALRVWDLESGERVAEKRVDPQGVSALALHPREPVLLVATSQGVLQLHQPETLELLETLPDRFSKVTALAFDSTGQHVAIADSQGSVWIETTSDWHPTRAWPAHQGSPVTSLAFRPQTTELATAGVDGRAILWETRNGERVRTLALHEGPVRALAFSPDGAWLATCGSDPPVRLWHAADGRPAGLLKGHTRAPQVLAFNSRGDRLATGARDGSVRLWNFPPDSSPTQFQAHTSQVSHLTLSANGQVFASAAADGRVICGTLNHPSENRPLLRSESGITALALAPDGGSLVVATPVTTERWDLTQSQPVERWQDHAGAVRCVAWSANAEQVATAGDEGLLRVRNRDGRGEVHVLSGHTKRVVQLAFSPDGQRLFSASEDDTVRVWNLATDKEVPGLRNAQANVLALVATPTGPLMAFQAEGRRLRTEELEPRGRVTSFDGDDLPRLRAAAFSPDGTRLFAAGERSIRLWDTETGRRLLTLGPHSAVITTVALAANQSCLIAGDRQGRILVFPARPLTAPSPPESERPGDRRGR